MIHIRQELREDPGGNLLPGGVRLHLAGYRYHVAVVRRFVDPLNGLLLVEPDVEDAILVDAVV